MNPLKPRSNKETTKPNYWKYLCLFQLAINCFLFLYIQGVSTFGYVTEYVSFMSFCHGLEESNKTIEENRNQTFTQFQSEVKKNPEGQIYLDRANQLKYYLDEFNKEISQIQKGVDNQGFDFEIKKTKIPFQVERLIKEYQKKFVTVFESPELKMELIKFEESLLPKLDRFHPTFKDWKTYHFMGMDYLGTLAVLEKIKSDAHFSVNNGIHLLKNKVYKEVVIFDAFDIVIVPKSKKVKIGEEFEAEVYLGTSSFYHPPTVAINGTKYPIVEHSCSAAYSTLASQVGKQSFKAEVSFKDGFGHQQSLVKNFTYEVMP